MLYSAIYNEWLHFFFSRVCWRLDPSWYVDWVFCNTSKSYVCEYNMPEGTILIQSIAFTTHHFFGVSAVSGIPAYFCIHVVEYIFCPIRFYWANELAVRPVSSLFLSFRVPIDVFFICLHCRSLLHNMFFFSFIEWVSNAYADVSWTMCVCEKIALKAWVIPFARCVSDA